MTNSREVSFLDRWLNLPEWNVAVFSFLLSFLWEMQQMPFYQVSPDFTYLDVTRNCTLATVGDVAITLTAFWTVAALSRSRQWFRRSSRKQMSIFIVIGVVITVIFEALATGPLNAWQYANSMPVIPLLRTRAGSTSNVAVDAAFNPLVCQTTASLIVASDRYWNGLKHSCCF